MERVDVLVLLEAKRGGGSQDSRTPLGHLHPVERVILAQGGG